MKQREQVNLGFLISVNITIYVAKHICRDDLLPLKYCLDYVAKQD